MADQDGTFLQRKKEALKFLEGVSQDETKNLFGKIEHLLRDAAELLKSDSTKEDLIKAEAKIKEAKDIVKDLKK